MESTIVIHVKSGVAEIANNPEEQSIVVIYFDKYATLPNMGDQNALIECPKCQHHGSQFDWNVATCDDFCDYPGTHFTRIQNAESGYYFTCAYCSETSTTEELGLIPVKPAKDPSAA